MGTQGVENQDENFGGEGREVRHGGTRSRLLWGRRFCWVSQSYNSSINPILERL